MPWRDRGKEAERGRVRVRERERERERGGGREGRWRGRGRERERERQIYIYIYRERERETKTEKRKRERERGRQRRKTRKREKEREREREGGRERERERERYIYIYIYIYYAVGGKFWPPERGILATKRFPLQNGAFFGGGSWPTWLCNRRAVSGTRWDQIPPYSFLVRKRHLDHRPNCSQTSIFIVVVSCKIGPISENPPKLPKRHHPESVVTRGRFWGGGFLYHFPFFWLYFFVASFRPLETMEALETPCFVVLSLVSCFENFRLPEPPPYDIFVDLLPFSNFGLKNPQKNSKHGGQIAWPEFPAFTVFFRQNFLPSADRVLAPKGILSRNPSFSSVFPPTTVLQAHSLRKGGDQIPLLKGSKKGASQRRTVESRRTTVSQRKHKKKNKSDKKSRRRRVKSQGRRRTRKTTTPTRTKRRIIIRRTTRRRSSRRETRKTSRKLKTEEAESQQRA